jgi:hypothetical protein
MCGWGRLVAKNADAESDATILHGDRRFTVVPFMQRYFSYQLQSLQKCPLEKWTEWAKSRGSENILVAQWLYGLTRDVSLFKLAGSSMFSPFHEYLAG